MKWRSWVGQELGVEVGGPYTAPFHVPYDETNAGGARWDVEVHVERGRDVAQAG